MEKGIKRNSQGWWRKSLKDLLENLIIALAFFCYRTKIFIKNDQLFV